MATYVPAITIPAKVFNTPAASILLPITLGSAVGWSVRREYPRPSLSISRLAFQPALIQFPRLGSNRHSRHLPRP
jgi:translocator protein